MVEGEGDNPMTTIGTLFSGGEGVGVGAHQAGLNHLWGVEYDDAIAQVARNNGFHTITGNVMDTALMLSLPRPDVLHASPVCKNASTAKADGEESPEDIASADATCAYIDHFRPDIFTLENVYGYRIFTAFAHIMECLNRNGYRFDYWHLNAADYGVPQTRKRLILVAQLHGKPRRPVATHAELSKLAPLFDTRLPWIGWYEAIEDLIDTLPASQFALWQLERLPKELQEHTLVNSAFPESNGRKDYKSNEPAFVADTLTLNHARAFILDGKPDNYAGDLTPLENDDPVMVVTGSQEKHQFGAFIVNESSTMEMVDSGMPVSTQVSSDRNINQRAWLSSGRVVKMTPRALARFQSFPDSYILPDKALLACTVIVNAVPPLLYQRVIEAQH